MKNIIEWLIKILDRYYKKLYYKDRLRFIHRNDISLLSSSKMEQNGEKTFEKLFEVYGTVLIRDLLDVLYTEYSKGVNINMSEGNHNKLIELQSLKDVINDLEYILYNNK